MLTVQRLKEMLKETPGKPKWIEPIDYAITRARQTKSL
jgi:hypothetical protein